ncbi:S4 domain-containing protein YaaA [Acetilactobacillus jinshanensis]|uniref:S4 domain-containing protein YaaA n=1 Tax=Acetilactobacillus jinshanensis TaxID=1720083 RepID=A0A4P6ZJB2_9LACO|nr:S4 domain-containing protein YaaA [Acetilactobacillus jinshanensis]QBP17603.1 S4 domain-containing protein YaaA [Acetilactobacillus jinshanensis]URL61853.1 S4 domain-containing protein YaaA [uncultured bacterium]
MKKTFYLNTDYITLGQLLKAESIVATGGRAKWYLKAHPVKLNGELENRRGKKLHPGDNVEISDHGMLFIRKK